MPAAIDLLLHRHLPPQRNGRGRSPARRNGGARSVPEGGLHQLRIGADGPMLRCVRRSSLSPAGLRAASHGGVSYRGRSGRAAARPAGLILTRSGGSPPSITALRKVRSPLVLVASDKPRLAFETMEYWTGFPAAAEGSFLRWEAKEKTNVEKCDHCRNRG